MANSKAPALTDQHFILTAHIVLYKGQQVWRVVHINLFGKIVGFCQFLNINMDTKSVENAKPASMVQNNAHNTKCP